MPRRMKYIIKSCPSDDTQALQNLLNEMSMNGWELYSMNETEVDNKLMFNCIFMIEEQDNFSSDSADIMNWGTVKNPIEKMLSPEMTPYEKCLELIDKIKSQKKKIAKIKSAIDDDSATESRKKYNDKISSSWKELEDMKKNLAKLTDPNKMFERLGVDDLSLFVGEELVPIVDTDSEEKENLFPEIIKMRYDLADTYGYIIPSIRILDSSNILPNEFVVAVRGLEVFKATAYPHHKMFFTSDLKLDKKMKDAIYDVDAITGREIVWVPEALTKDFWMEGLKTSQYIVRAIKFIAIKYVDELLSYRTLEKYCRLVEADNEFLIANIIPDVISFADLRYIFTSLIAERVPIKDITFLFSKLNDYAEDSSRADLLNRVRLGLSRSICMQYADEEGVISGFEISDKTLDKMLPSLDEADAIVKIDSDFAEKLAKKLIKQADEYNVETPILIAPMELRQVLFTLLIHYVNDVVVLAREEIGTHCRLEIIEEI